MTTVRRTVPAPDHLGVAMARVPEGSDLELDLRLESVVEGVLVTGTVRFTVEAECGRCLEPFAWDEEASLTELFAYPVTDARGRVLAEQPDDDDAPAVVQDDLIDLDLAVRDAVVLPLPITPTCRPDCAGLCPDCGVRLDDDPGHRHDRSDPRWDALRALADTDSTTDSTARKDD